MILVTGSKGFIGSHVMNSTPKSIGIDNTDRKTKNQEWVKCDLTDYNCLFWLMSDIRPEIVIHLAAIPSVPASYADPIKTYINNVNASINLIKVSKLIGVKKFIFASSSSVDGPSPYGHSKKVIEDILWHSGLNYTVLRFFNVFGNGQRENVLQIMHDKIKNNENIYINGDGSISRDFTYIDNVLLAIKMAQNNWNKEIIEVGTGRSHSLMELYKTLREKLNPAHNKVFLDKERIGDIKYSCAKTALPNDKIIHFQEGIDKWLYPSLAAVSSEALLSAGLNNTQATL